MSRFSDPNLTHGQRCVVWSMVHEMVAEDPPGSNRGPEISEWLRPCQRDGYGPEFGEHLAKHGANWCAGMACAADRAARYDGDPPPVHGYRASGIEMENDAKAVGAWRDAQLVLDGSWEPAEGDVVIWQSGDGSVGQAWRRHVARFISHGTDAGEFLAIGGNEGNRVVTSGGRPFDNPMLRGFIELPRVAPLEDPIREAVNVEVLRRAVELEERLWTGVVGMDAFDELLAKLEATDPREW
jgi:hypothetical protein